MKKIYTNFYIVVILFASYNIINASCPWLPSGYSSTPSWQSALSNKIKITNDCWLIYEYCWRVNSSGQKEIIIGSIRTEGSTPWYMFSSCLNELNKRKEMMLDKAIAQIVLESQKFGATTLLPCPN